MRFALVGVCYISEEHARLSGPPHHRDTLHVCVEHVVAGAQSGFQRCFDDGGLFLVMDAG